MKGKQLWSGVLLALVIAMLSVFLYLLLQPSSSRDKVSSSHNGGTEWQLVAQLQQAGSIDLKRPMQIISYQGKFLVSDSGNGQISVYTLTGRYLNSFGKQGSGKLIFPYGLAIAQDKLLVSDLERGEIVMFSLEGRYLGTFPNPGGIIKRPAGLAVYGQRLYVTDLEQQQVLSFDLQGKLLSRWGSGHKGDTYLDFTYPNEVLPAGDKVYISDTGNNRIQVFTPEGDYVKTIVSSGQGNMVNNRGLALSPRGNLLAASTMTNTILLLSPAGEFQGSFKGNTAEGGHLSLPNGLNITNSGEDYLLAIADKGNNQVCIYRLPQEW